MKKIKKRIGKLLRWSQKYTKTDMIYVARGGFWLSVGKVFITLASIITTIAFANLIPAETYGTYLFIISTAGIVGISSLPGMGSAMIRSVAKGKEGSLDTAFKTKFKWALIGSVVFLLMSGWYYVNENIILSVAFLIISPIFPLKLSSGVFAGFWNGKKRFDKKTILRVLVDVAIATSVIITLLLTDDLWIIVFIFFFSTATAQYLAYLYSSKRKDNEETDEEMIPYGKNLTLMSIIDTTASHLDKIIIWKLLGPAQVAVYTLSIKPIKKVKGFLPISSLALPKLSENGIKDQKRKKKILRKILMLFLVSVPFAVFLFFFGPFIYKIVFPEYMESVKFFQAMTFLIAMLPTTILKTALVAEKKTKYLYITRTTVPLIKITLFLILTPIYGIWGVVSTLLIISIVSTVFNLYFFWKI